MNAFKADSWLYFGRLGGDVGTLWTISGQFFSILGSFGNGLGPFGDGLGPFGDGFGDGLRPFGDGLDVLVCDFSIQNLTIVQIQNYLKSSEIIGFLQ